MLKGTTLHCYAHGHITTLALRKTKIVYFWSHACVWTSNLRATGCTCAFFVSEMSIVPQPISVRILTSWPLIAFGSIPTLVRHFLAIRLPFSVISNRHTEARSWKQASGWWILSKKKTTHQNFREEYYTENVSVRCTINAECQVCEVQRFFSSWDFSFACGGMYDVEQRINSKCHINKGKVIGSTLKN